MIAQKIICKVVIKTVQAKWNLKRLNNFHKILQYQNLIKIGLSAFKFHVYEQTKF
jgi:hypothetical protein